MRYSENIVVSDYDSVYLKLKYNCNNVISIPKWCVSSQGDPKQKLTPLDLSIGFLMVGDYKAVSIDIDWFIRTIYLVVKRASRFGKPARANDNATNHF
jgi:hypothetical protein